MRVIGHIHSVTIARVYKWKAPQPTRSNIIKIKVSKSSISKWKTRHSWLNVFFLMLHGRACIPDALWWSRADTARTAASRRRVGWSQEALLSNFARAHSTASHATTINGRIRRTAIRRWTLIVNIVTRTAWTGHYRCFTRRPCSCYRSRSHETRNCWIGNWSNVWCNKVCGCCNRIRTCILQQRLNLRMLRWQRSSTSHAPVVIMCRQRARWIVQAQGWV